MEDKIIQQLMKIQKRDKSRNDLNEFILFLKEGKDIYNKNNYDGHLCGSSWIVDSKEEKALLIHHPKLKKWMQPGGHLEENEIPYETAIRELKEETNININNVRNKKEILIDAGIHEFKHSSKPEHIHYDLRYYFDVNSKKVNIKSEEGVEIKWVKFQDIPDLDMDGTLTRMVDYTKKINNKIKLKL